MKKNEKNVTQEIISRTPLTNSNKVYVEGKLHPIKVAMREIVLSETKLANGKTELNHPVAVYDTSGSYTDPRISIDIKKGLPRLREQWIVDRKDVEQLDAVSSKYGKERMTDASLDNLRFEHLRSAL